MGGRKQFRVTGTVNGVPMKSSTFPYKGEGLWLGVHKATREKAGVAFGDEIEIEISARRRAARARAGAGARGGAGHGARAA